MRKVAALAILLVLIGNMFASTTVYGRRQIGLMETGVMGYQHKHNLVVSNLPSYVAVHRVNQPVVGLWLCSELARDLGKLVQPTNLAFKLSTATGLIPEEIKLTVVGPGVSIESNNSVPYSNLEPNTYHYNPVTGVVTVCLQPSMAGELKLEVWAYDKRGNFIGSFTHTLPVKGYVVNISQQSIEQGQSVDLEVVVTTNDGQPVNNCKVVIWGWFTAPREAGGPGQEVRGGRYVFEDLSIEESQQLSVLVVNKRDRVQAYLPGVIAVRGERSYSIELNTQVVVSGLQTELSFRVKGHSTTDFLAERGTQVFLGSIDVTRRTSYDAEKGLYVIRNAVLCGETALTFSTGYGKHYGQITITPIDPELRISVESITSGFCEHVTASIHHPITGGALKGSLRITEIDLLSADYLLEPGVKVSRHIIEGLIAEEHSFRVMALGSSVETASSALRFDVELDALVQLNKRLIVRPAVLEVSPRVIEAGTASQLTLKYANSRREPLIGYSLFSGTSLRSLGTTDEKGAHTVQLLPTTAGTFTLFAATDIQGYLVAVPLTVVKDTGPPIIEMYNLPEVTQAESFTLEFSVKDENSISVAVNQSQLLPEPDGKVRCSFALKPGINTVRIEATDVLGKSTVKVFEILHQPPEGEALLSLEPGTPPDGWPAAPFLDSRNRTITPLAPLAKSLGVECRYDAESKTAELQYEDSRVLVTAGSALLVINGVNYTMDGIAYEEKGHIYVPLRHIVEALGFRVEFDKATGRISIFAK